MRNRIFWLLALVSFLAAGQDIIDNPAKPAAPDAGRILNLKEVWRVSDESGVFYFKYPYRLKIGPEGSIYLQDSEELLKFSPDGRFIANLFKKGQGPGEMSPRFSYMIDRRELVIHDSGLKRLWRADVEGRLLSEMPLEKTFRGFILGIYGDNLVFWRDEDAPSGAGIPGFADVPHMVGLLSKDGKSEVDIQPFYFKRYLVGPRGGLNWGNALKTLSEDGRFVYGFHGRDYLIEVMDLKERKIVRRFRRAYPRVPETETKEQREWRENEKLPKADYKADIINLIPDGSRIWAETSTEDPEKGRLWDVFDDRGAFVDSFYLGPGRTLLRVAGEEIFVLEPNRDETLSLVKYRIID